MCGIAGYIKNGEKIVDKELLELLKNLEYRGYDSAGVATLNKDIDIVKNEGSIENLEKELTSDEKAVLGIAHTRWATHGEPSMVNSHPFKSSSGEWAIVHNGIIENYVSLKAEVLGWKNILFSSKTDSEVVAHLLDKYNQKNKLKAVIQVCQRIVGSFAFVCINKTEKDSLFLAKRKSPLYVAEQNGEIFIASDPICFYGKAEKYFSLEDDEFCKASKLGLFFFNANGESISKDFSKLADMDTEKERGEYEHFMLKEIMGEPKVLDRIIRTYSESKPFRFITDKFLDRYNKIIFVGCGTAYHSGLVGVKYLKEFCRIESSCEIASEYRYSKPLINKETLVVLISQSGETADTLAVNELAKKSGATTIAITNVLYSTLAKQADVVLPVCAGPEIAVASTKAYIAQVAVLYAFAKNIAYVKFGENSNYLENISAFRKAITQVDFSVLEDLSKEIAKTDKVFYLGRDIDNLMALEGSLKLKEITYINSQSYPLGELKHGYLALIDNETFAIVVATQQELLEKTLNGVNEAISRGAKVVLITPFVLSEEQTKNIYKIIRIENLENGLTPLLSMPYLQMLGYKTSVLKGINPDKPRNLAKSVTVE